MCTVAVAVESLRRGDELGKEGEQKTKDILGVPGPQQSTLWWLLPGQ